MSLFLQMKLNDNDQVPVKAKSSAISKQYVYPNRYALLNSKLNINEKEHSDT